MAGGRVLLWGLPWTWCPRGTLYTVKACSQELGGMQDDTVFLQLDISSALIPYNSGPSWLSFVTTGGAQALQRAARSSIGSFHIQCWNSNFSMLSGKSSNKLVPKGLPTHLFGRLVAAHFDKLCRGWGLAGELPAFLAGQCPLWGIWYIDDAICFFCNAAQFARLVPSLVQCLAGLGLNVNIAKSCTLSCFGSCRAIPCLPRLPHVMQSTYLGLKLLLEEGDDHMLQGYLRRTSAAFLCVLLQPGTADQHACSPTCSAPAVSSSCHKRHPLVSVLSPSAHHVCALRVQHVIPWLVGCFAVPRISWQDPQTIPVSDMPSKIWLQSYSKLWDYLLLEQWKWLGQILWLPRTFLRQTLLNLRPTSRACGHRHRRSRTEPNNSGHSLALRWLRHQGVDPSLAHDRHAWDSLALALWCTVADPTCQCLSHSSWCFSAYWLLRYPRMLSWTTSAFQLFCLFLPLTRGWLGSWIVLEGGDVCTLMPLWIF